MIKQEIKIPIYNAKVIIIFTDDLPSAMSEYSDEDCETDAGITVHFDTPLNYVMAFLIDPLCHMLVSHEVCHLTHRVMNDVGISPSLLYDEPEAYLNGYITNEVYRIIKENKLMCYGTKG